MEITKTAMISVVGRANTGKSTLTNTLVGEKIAITSPKPQTTRNKILGIMHGDGFQAVFTDTPGFHKPQNRLGENMIKAVDESIGDADLAILVVEPTDEVSASEENIIKKIGKIPSVLVINKCDTTPRKNLLSVIAKYNSLADFAAIVPVSARTGENVSELESVIKENLPKGPMYYPDDMVTDQSEKQIVSEIIREKMLYVLRQEIPHGAAVEIAKMKYDGSKDGGMYNISANIFCEKNSHKGIIIGAGGKTLKKIGTLARQECEKMLECKVYLELWVKVKEDWRNSENLIKELGIGDVI